MVKLKVISVDDAEALVLPEEALARLKVKIGDELALVETPNGYRLTAVESNSPEER